MGTKNTVGQVATNPREPSTVTSGVGGADTDSVSVPGPAGAVALHEHAAGEIVSGLFAPARITTAVAQQTLRINNAGTAIEGYTPQAAGAIPALEPYVTSLQPLVRYRASAAVVNGSNFITSVPDEGSANKTMLPWGGTLMCQRAYDASGRPYMDFLNNGLYYAGANTDWRFFHDASTSFSVVLVLARTVAQTQAGEHLLSTIEHHYGSTGFVIGHGSGNFLGSGYDFGIVVAANWYAYVSHNRIRKTAPVVTDGRQPYTGIEVLVWNYYGATLLTSAGRNLGLTGCPNNDICWSVDAWIGKRRAAQAPNANTVWQSDPIPEATRPLMLGGTFVWQSTTPTLRAQCKMYEAIVFKHHLSESEIHALTGGLAAQYEIDLNGKW
jgi:hypothetical protein